jgi:hypothetical protein
VMFIIQSASLLDAATLLIVQSSLICPSPIFFSPYLLFSLP